MRTNGHTQFCTCYECREMFGGAWQYVPRGVAYNNVYNAWDAVRTAQGFEVVQAAPGQVTVKSKRSKGLPGNTVRLVPDVTISAIRFKVGSTRAAGTAVAYVKDANNRGGILIVRWTKQVSYGELLHHFAEQGSENIAKDYAQR